MPSKLGLVAVAAVALIGITVGHGQASGTLITLAVIPVSAASPSIALDSSGNPVVAYGATEGLMLLHCNDPGCTGGDDTPTNVTEGGGPVSMALDDNGYPVVSYTVNVAAPPGLDYDIRVLHCNDADCVGGDESIETAILNANLYSDLVLDSNGFPVVAYRAAPTVELGVMHCNDANCSGGDEAFGAVQTLGSTQSPAIVLDIDGYPVITVIGADDDLLVVHCNDPTCQNGDESVTTPQAGHETILRSPVVLDSAGNPVIVYEDRSAGPDELKLIHCNDANCADGDEDVAVLGIEPQYRALRLDAAGNPIVAFNTSQPPPFYKLAVVRCGDPICADGGTMTMVDDFSQTGYGVSFVLDQTGAPVIAHVRIGEPELRIVHCGDPGCDIDLDDDGCRDIREQQTASGSETLGGLRNSKNPHDYMNPTHDGQNRIDDVLMVVQAYFDDDADGNPGQPPYAPGYNPDTDRTALGPNVWNLGPPNGQQRIDDILAIIGQYFHDCS